MFNRLLLFFIALPLVELVLMLVLSRYVGLGWTVLFIVGTGLLGTWLAHSQGLSTYRRIQQELAQGRMPTDSLIDGVLILIAGLLLITPGLLTDLTGIVLMIPPSRSLCRRWLIARFKQHFRIQTLVPAPQGARGDVVDSYATEAKGTSVESVIPEIGSKQG